MAKTTASISITKQVLAAAKRHAKTQHRSLSAQLEKWIAEKLSQEVTLK